MQRSFPDNWDDQKKRMMSMAHARAGELERKKGPLSNRKRNMMQYVDVHIEIFPQNEDSPAEHSIIVQWLFI